MSAVLEVEGLVSLCLLARQNSNQGLTPPSEIVERRKGRNVLLDKALGNSEVSACGLPASRWIWVHVSGIGPRPTIFSDQTPVWDTDVQHNPEFSADCFMEFSASKEHPFSALIPHII
jgi:hypothetical protein